MSVMKIKQMILRWLPDGVVHALRKAWYPRVVARFDENRWPPSSIARQLVKPGDCVVDAGANIGYVTAMLARWVGAKGKVLSFEPVPETFDLLRHNVEILRLSQVSLFNCALSSSAREAEMNVPRYAAGYENPYEARIVNSSAVEGAGRRVRVTLQRLDDVLAGLAEQPVFLKIDVEGHELDVLRGSMGIIRRCHPAMVIEIGEDRSRARDLLQLLRDNGYSAFRPGPAGLDRVGSDDELRDDCFFLTEGQYTACRRGLEGTALRV